MDRMNLAEFNDSDAIHAGSCDVYGIKHIASNDKDFGRVDFLKRWTP